MIDYDYLRKEYITCLKDKSRVYMITHYLKTYDTTVNQTVPFSLFPRQQDLCQLLGSANNVVTTKPRQAGITTTVAAFVSCELALSPRESPKNILIIGNTIDLSQNMLFKIREFLEQLPWWFFGDEFYNDDISAPADIHKLYVKRNDKYVELFNGCKIYAKSSGKDASRGVSSVHWLIVDEAAFIADGVDTFSSALAATSTGGHTVMISTPNGKDQLYYETCRRAELKGTDDWNNFELIKLKWIQDPRYSRFLEWTKKNPETGEVDVVAEPTLDKLGNIKYDEEHWEKMEADGWKPRSPWYIKMCRQFNNDPKKIAQELDVSFLGSGSNVVEPEAIQMQRDLNVREPLYVDPLCEDTWVWKKPIEGHRYLCACIPEGERIPTVSGYKNIESVTPKDVLFNENGEKENIVECKRRMVSDEDVYSIRLSNVYKPMRFTGNHPILSSTSQLKRWYSKTNNVTYRFNERYHEHDFKFVNARDVNIGDWVKLPNFFKNNRVTEEEIIVTLKQYGIQDLATNTDFWWYCGMWMAEGCCWNNYINTTHNINETFIHKRITSFLVSIGCKYGLKSNQKEHSLNIYFAHEGIERFLKDHIGQHAKNKQISMFIKCLPDNLRNAFVDGYFNGDGSIYENKRDGILVSFGSVSLNLLLDLQDILWGSGIISCVSLSHRGGVGLHFGRMINCNDLYELRICNIYAEKFVGGTISKTPKIANCYFSKDENFIYFKVKDIQCEKYNGYVYNFETESHTYCAERCITHNCDPSRGDSADRTAIEILDMDGIDDDGTPCIEQVLEYHGKKLGDTIGEMIYQYATMYGDAFTVVECIGGVGDAAVLTLQRLGYKNLYYDDASLKNYTIQREASTLQVTTDGKMPGFHTNAVRDQMLIGFADMIRKNAIKIRSKRVLAELDTWIYKGPSQRIDHMSGYHDDTLTCLAMGLFVMKYSLNKLIEAKKRDVAFLKALSGIPINGASSEDKQTDIKDKYPTMFYTNRSFEQSTFMGRGELIPF